MFWEGTKAVEGGMLQVLLRFLMVLPTLAFLLISLRFLSRIVKNEHDG